MNFFTPRPSAVSPRTDRKGSHRSGTIVLIGTIVLSLLWSVLVGFFPRSPLVHVMPHRGEQPMLDYRFTRNCAVCPAPYGGGQAEQANYCLLSGRMPRADICYPALSYALFRLLPDGEVGLFAYEAVSMALFFLAIVCFLGRHDVSLPMASAGACLCAYPVLCAIWVGNPILLTAACATLFLAWWDAPDRTRRVLAAIALGAAFAFKVIPALFGVLYFGRGFRRRLPYAALAAVSGIVLLVVPFFLFGGFEAFKQWLGNAALNSRFYCMKNIIGPFALYVSLAGRWIVDFAEWPRLTLGVRLGTSVLGLVSLLIGAFVKRTPLARMLLVVSGALMIPETMMIYTYCYLLPIYAAGVFVRDRGFSLASGLAFAAVAALPTVFRGSEIVVMPLAFTAMTVVALCVRPDDGPSPSIVFPASDLL